MTIDQDRDKKEPQGKLARIGAILAEFNAGSRTLTEDAALDAIAAIVASRRRPEQTYQKPLG